MTRMRHFSRLPQGRDIVRGGLLLEAILKVGSWPNAVIHPAS